MRKAFTVLELLVASLLLSMLVTILTMIFNQSSIAWTTCLASEGQLSGVRVKLSAIHDVADDVLPGLGQDNVSASGSSDNRELEYRTVSLFKGWDGTRGGFANLRSSSALRENSGCSGRAYDWFSEGQLGGFFSRGGQLGSLQNFFGAKVLDTGTGGAKGASSGKGASGGGGGGTSTYVVGVRSWGPDGEPDTDDDITSYPESAK